MIISTYSDPQIQSLVYSSYRPSFQGNFVIETLKHTNIGDCMDGYIGKVRVRRGCDNTECFLNVFKKHITNDKENYSIKNDFGDIIGEANITIKKMYRPPYQTSDWVDPSHVFVDDLRNYSNPRTPFYKEGLVYMKDIGTRLLQIAQRRSDETICNGEIKLNSMPESKKWYMEVIGMEEDVPKDPFFRRFANPNILRIPPEKKEPLSKLNGGL